MTDANEQIFRLGQMATQQRDAAYAEIQRLRAELEAANQHIKTLRERARNQKRLKT